MRKPVDTLADKLGHPEGPDILPDGRVVMVETYRSRISAWSPVDGLQLYADCGGGPNACMLGADGAVYITQNGGTVGAWTADVMVPPAIQKAWPDGRVEEIVTEIEGIRLLGPNDLTFGPDGKLYFTDPGDYYPHDPSTGRLFALRPDGTGELIEEVGPSYPNGIVAEPDGSVVWVESYTRDVIRRRPDGAKERLCTLPDGHIPDGFKIDARGNFWITVFGAGGLDVVAPDGSYVEFVETGGVPLNCAFGGSTMYVCDFGTTDTSGGVSMGGRLFRFDAGVDGMPLFTGAIGEGAA